MIKGIPLKIENAAQWHSLRSIHIGGSELGSLFGVSPFQTKYGLWLIKAGLSSAEIPDTERMMFGRLLEGPLRQAVAEKLGCRVRKVNRYFSAAPDVRLGGTPDAEILDYEGETATLETKIVDGLEFRDNWGEEPPLSYVLQTMGYLGLRGHRLGVIAALVGGNRLVTYRIERRESTIDMIVGAVDAFWQSIADENPPSPDWERDSAVLSRVYSDVSGGKTLDLTGSNRAAELCALYDTASKEEAAAAKRKTAARSEMLSMIGDAALVLADGYRVVSSAVPAIPERTITLDDVGGVIKGRSGFRQLRVYEGR